MEGTVLVRPPLVALAALVCSIALLGPFAGGAEAAPITVGPKLSSSTVSGAIECEQAEGCTVASKTPSFVAPVTGTIVTWRVKGAAGGLTLRVLQGNTSTESAGTAFGLAEAGKSVFTASLPINAGERFAIDLPHESSGNEKLGYEESSTSALSFWGPKLGPKETRAPKEKKELLLLANVDIQPAPKITSVSPAQATLPEITSVTIEGQDLAEATSVEFGSQVEGIESNTDTKIVASVVGFTPGTVPVKVTTPGGTALKSNAFTFLPEPGTTPPEFTPITAIPPIVIPPEVFPEETFCHIPKLKGKTLKAARRELAAAHCGLGSVTKRRGVKAKKGKVVSQVPPPSSPPVPVGSQVQVRLG